MFTLHNNDKNNNNYNNDKNKNTVTIIIIIINIIIITIIIIILSKSIFGLSYTMSHYSQKTIIYSPFWPVLGFLFFFLENGPESDLLPENSCKWP